MKIRVAFETIFAEALSFLPYEEIDVFQIRFLLHSRWIYQYRHIHIDYGLATNGHDDKSETGLFNHQGGKALAASIDSLEAPCTSTEPNIFGET